MSDRSTHEPLLPQISLRWMIGLVTASAISMGIFQQAVTSGQMWSVLLAVAITSVLVPLLMYAGSFALASLFSTVGSAAAGIEKPRPIHSPTMTMPVVRANAGQSVSQGADDE